MTFAVLSSHEPARFFRFHAAAPVLTTLACALAVLACGDTRADADAVKSLVNREAAAINGKDMRALSEIWSQDKDILLFDVPPPGRFRGWDQIGRLWRDFFERVSDIHLTVDSVQAEVQGSLGYATYDWSMTGQLGSYPLQDRGQATAIYRKQDGRWRLIHAHYSPVPPALVGQAASQAPADSGARETSGSPAAAGSAAAPGGAGPSGSPSPAASPPGAAAPRKASKTP